jgi:hypothetical protein
MIANAKCQHCGNVFETDGMNKTEFCPHCGKETFIVGQAFDPAPANTAAALKQIREQTCYKTLRELIGVVQILFFIAAGLAGLGVTGNFLELGQVASSIGGILLAVIIGLVSAFILIVLGIAWKQAALLLVDIADCQIRLAGNTASR